MLYELFYENGVSSFYENWLDIANELGFEDPDADEIWELVRCCDKPPHLGNAFQAYTLSQICSWLEERGYDCDYYVNSLDTHLFIDGEAIYDKESFWSKVAELDNLVA